MPLNASASEPQMKKRPVAFPAAAAPPMKLDQRRSDCPVCVRLLSRWRIRRMPQAAGQIARCAGCGLLMVGLAPQPAALDRFHATSGHSQERPPSSAADILARETTHPNSMLDARRMRSPIKRLRNVSAGVGC